MAAPRALEGVTARDEASSAFSAPSSWGWTAATAAWAAAIALVLLLNAYKGAIGDIQIWGWPYWLVSYQDGLIRRGLAGEVFHLLFGKPGLQALHGPILVQHWLFIMAIAAAAATMAGQILARLELRSGLAFLGFAAWFFASQCWPTLAFNTGYMDPVVMALAVGAALCLRAGWIAPAAVLMIIGPFVHEYFMFFLPFILAAPLAGPADPDMVTPLDQDPGGPSRLSLLVVAGLCVLAAGVSTFAADPEATASQINQMPQPQVVRDMLLSTTLTQGFGQAFSHMAEQWTIMSARNLWNLSFFMLPALVCSAGILFWRARPTMTAWLQVLAGLFPVLALLLAWDLSRLLVASNVTCGLLFLFAAQRRSASPRPTDGASAWLGALSTAAAAAYSLLPFIYTYFPPAPAYVHYPDAVNASRLADAIKQPMHLFWEGGASRGHPLDLMCGMSSTLPTAAIGPACSRALHRGEILASAAAVLAPGRYRMHFAVDPIGDCADGRIGLLVTTSRRTLPISKASVFLGGRLAIDMDMAIGTDIDEGVVLKATGLEGDNCATLTQASISRLETGR